MNKDFLIQEIEKLVYAQFNAQSADHDFFHIQRVVKLAQFIQQSEGGDYHVVTAGAWLHDISDHKLNGGVLNDNGRASRVLLERLNAPESFIESIVQLVDAVSYKGAMVADIPGSIELAIVRDADRLDAIGAIGIARALHYGGHHNRPFYLPNMDFELHESFETYANATSHTLNHFHEKLLLLKDRMQTVTGKKIAEKRHALMENFVQQFYLEWDGKDF